MMTNQETLTQLDFQLTTELKRVGMRIGYRARALHAPKKLTFKECSVDEKKKILEVLRAAPDFV